MLSEAKHLRSIFVVRGSRIGSEIESLASRTSSTALQLRFAQNDTMRLQARSLGRALTPYNCKTNVIDCYRATR